MRKPILMPLSAAALLLASAICGGTAATPQPDRRETINRNYDIFTSVVNAVDANYVDSLPLQEMFDNAIDGFLAPLDPYTSFFSEKETKEFFQDSKGEYAGIGSYLLKIGDYVVINQPTEGSPAQTAGLRTGDRVLRIDSTDARGMSIEAARGHFLGMPGTPVSIRVARPYAGPDSVIDFTVVRAKLSMPTVTYSDIDADGIAYIQLSQFGEHSPKELRDALQRVMAGRRLKGLIIDLADNGGGMLESAVGILEMLVPKGTTVLTTKGRERTRKYVTTRSPLLPDGIPVAVLVNGSTASASEVTAGVLQDLDRAVLVGTKTYGKGLVQSTMPTPYNTMVKVTTSKYYIPSGRLIQAYDYSRRNADGSVAHLPDSLARPFRTAAGRIVYDGGGLSPDSVVSFGKANNLIYRLVEDHVIFDFANRYAATHDTIGSPFEFRIDDRTFADFKAGIDPGSFRYDKESEELVRRLRKTAADEGYLTPEVERQIDLLAASLAHNLESDLDASRPQIEMLLGPEIMSRYYGSRGHIINFRLYDPRFRTAKAILLDPALYKAMLSAPKDRKKAK